MTDLQTDAIDHATQAVLDQLETDIVGAWQAGYNYMHVYHTFGIDSHDTFDVGTYTVPAYAPQPPGYDLNGATYTRTYDLDGLTRAQARHVRTK